jgi:YVTN family beta-propeller protein
MQGPAALAALLIGALMLTACDRGSTARVPPSLQADAARLYVSDETGGIVAVVDPEAGQVLERIAVGKRPRGIVLSRDGTQILVALSGSPIAGPGVDESTLPPPDRAADGIGVLDLATRKLVRTFRSGQDPESFDISPDGRTAYVSNEDAAEMSILDLATGNVTGRVRVGEEPEAVAVSPDGRVVYVGCEAENQVVAVDPKTAAVIARISTGARPRGIAFTADGTMAFVADENGGTVTVVDVRRHTVSSTIAIPRTDGTPTAPRPMGVALSPDGRQAFVSLGRARSVAVIDAGRREFVRSIEDVGMRPWGIAVSRDGRRLYSANGPSGDVSVVDLATGKVEKRIATGGSPWGVVVALR